LDVSSPVRERRWSPRIARTLPLTLHTGSRTLPVRTVDVSDDGVLLVTSEALSTRSAVVLSHPASGRHASGWVVRCVTGEAHGEFEVAIELLEPSPAFWDDGGRA